MYLLTSIADAGVQLIFLKFSAGHILFFFGLQAQVPFFQEDFCLLLVYGESWISSSETLLNKSHVSFAFGGG